MSIGSTMDLPTAVMLSKICGTLLENFEKRTPPPLISKTLGF